MLTCKYCDLSVSCRSVICFSLQLWLRFDLLATNVYKSQYFAPYQILVLKLLQIWTQVQQYSTKYRYSPFLWKRSRYMSICPKRPQCKICWRNAQIQCGHLTVSKASMHGVSDFTDPNFQPERLILDTCMNYLLAFNWFSDYSKIKHWHVWRARVLFLWIKALGYSST